jgi:hypothetical protein
VIITGLITQIDPPSSLYHSLCQFHRGRECFGINPGQARFERRKPEKDYRSPIIAEVLHRTAV